VLGELQDAERAGDTAGEVEDPDTFEHLHVVAPFRSSPWVLGTGRGRGVVRR
jgi:hypothetical protein